MIERQILSPRERFYSRHLYVLSYLIFNVQTLSSLLLRIISVCEKEEEDLHKKMEILILSWQYFSWHLNTT